MNDKTKKEQKRDCLNCKHYAPQGLRFRCLMFDSAKERCHSGWCASHDFNQSEPQKGAKA